MEIQPGQFAIDVKNLQESIKQVFSGLKQADDARQIQKREVEGILKSVFTETLPIQTSALQNDNYELQIRDLKQELEQRLENHNQLKHRYEQLTNDQRNLIALVDTGREQHLALIRERQEYKRQYEQFTQEITEYMNRIKGIENIYHSEVTLNNQSKYNDYDTVCKHESENDILRQVNVQLKSRLDQLRSIDVVATSKVLQEAAATINMLNHKIGELKKQINLNRENNNEMQIAMTATTYAQDINSRSIVGSRINASGALAETNRRVVDQVVNHSRVQQSQTQFDAPQQIQSIYTK